MIAATNEMVLESFSASGLMSPDGFEIDEIAADGVRIFVITPTDLDPADTRVYLEPHGGAFIVGGGDICRTTGVMTARKLGMRLCGRSTTACHPTIPIRRPWTTVLSAYRALLDAHASRNGRRRRRVLGWQPERRAHPPREGRRISRVPAVANPVDTRVGSHTSHG